MKAVVLAAGFGSRLQPFTSNRPKHMLPVGGKPILLHGIEYIRDVLNITDIIIVVGYQRHYIMNYFKDGKEFGLNIQFVIQHMNGKKGLGAALELVEGYVTTDFCLYLADNLFGANLKKVVDLHSELGSSVTLHVEEHSNPSRFGVVMREGNKIISVVEKPINPPSNLVITGFYVFSPAIFHALAKLKPSGRGEYELTDAIQIMIEDGYTVICSEISGWRQDIGFPSDILESNEHLMDDKGSIILSDTRDCKIIKPVYIGEHCKLSASTIGPYTTIGKNSSILNSRVEHTVVLENSVIEECSLNKSVVGSKCNIKGLTGHSVKLGDFSTIISG
ncbi:MAG: NTP transferase domain-containing protein [Candidatus Heimdallarchaeota archaeon]|nr:NTP transferase domain-containing protein [Candidatus Heimdallarchaeota archaeon]